MGEREIDNKERDSLKEEINYTKNKETQSTRQAIETHMGEELMHKSSFKTQELLRWKGDNKGRQENS